MKYLYLHGLGQNAQAWNGVIENTGSREDSICLDLAQMTGREEATYARLYRAFSEICNEEKDELILCGLSLGSVLSLHYAIDHPEKIKALVLIAAQYKMPKRLLKLQNIMFRFMPAAAFRETGFEKKDFISLCSTMAQLDFSGAVDQILCPVLLVCGEKDRANKAASVELSGILKNSRLQIIEGAGHEVNVEAPERLAKILQNFYNREHLKPIIRASICTGEQVAGFKDLRTGKIEEVMLIKGQEDLEKFKRMYGITGEIEKEY